MKMKHILWHSLTIICMIVLFCGCKSMRELKNLQRCDFEFASISDFEYAGVKFNSIRSINDIEVENVTRILAAATSKTCAISFNVNVKVTNQSASWASLNAMKWTLYADGDKLLDGELFTPFSVEPHCSGIMMLRASMVPSIRGKAAPLQQIFRIYQNIMGFNADEPSNLTLKIKPTVNKTELPYITLKLN